MKWEQAASTAMFVSLSRFQFGCNSQTKKKQTNNKTEPENQQTFWKVFWNRRFSFRRVKTLKKPLLSLAQKISYLRKAPSFLISKAVHLPSCYKPTLTAKSWILHWEGAGAEEQHRLSSAWDREPARPRPNPGVSPMPGDRTESPGLHGAPPPPAQPARLRPNPGVSPMPGDRCDSPGLPAAPSPPAQPAPEEPSSFALYFQSCSLLAARLCTERSRHFAPSF